MLRCMAKHHRARFSVRERSDSRRQAFICADQARPRLVAPTLAAPPLARIEPPNRTGSLVMRGRSAPAGWGRLSASYGQTPVPPPCSQRRYSRVRAPHSLTRRDRLNRCARRSHVASQLLLSHQSEGGSLIEGGTQTTDFADKVRWPRQSTRTCGPLVGERSGAGGIKWCAATCVCHRSHRRTEAV